jgi:arylformamidase
VPAAAKYERDERLERIERYTRPAELLVSIGLVAALIAPFIIDFSPSQLNQVDQISWFLWAVLGADYLFRLIIARYKIRFVRSNLLDLAVVVLPLLTPLLPAAQFFQAMRALRVVVLVFDIGKELRSVFRSKNLPHVIGVVVLVIFVCGAIEYGFEHNAKTATIHSLGDGLWWAITTFTTVGYGDTYPVTTAGRGLAILVMIVGLTFGGVLAAALVSVFIQNDAADRGDSELVERIAALEAKIDGLAAVLGGTPVRAEPAPFATPADINAEYDASCTVPSLEPYFAQYTAESERVRSAYECRLDLEYGDGERERLDLFLAPRPGAPILLFMHGGYWRRMSKTEFSFFAEPFVRAGAAVAIPSYSLCPVADLDEIVRQMRSAVAWLVENAALANGDPRRIVASGHSAGGQLSGMLAGTDWSQHGLRENPISGVCGISGLYDLAPVQRSSINEWLRLDADGARRNSPILHLPHENIPLVCAVGELETNEFQRQTLDFATAWRELGHPSQCVVMPGLNHYDIILDVLRDGSALREGILGLL